MLANGLAKQVLDDFLTAILPEKCIVAWPGLQSQIVGVGADWSCYSRWQRRISLVNSATIFGEQDISCYFFLNLVPCNLVVLYLLWSFRSCCISRNLTTALGLRVYFVSCLSPVRISSTRVQVISARGCPWCFLQSEVIATRQGAFADNL